MKKAKILAFVITIITILMMVLPVMANENTETEQPVSLNGLEDEDQMVYLTGPELDRAYDLLTSDSCENTFFIKEGWFLVKESITPVYTVDMYEYAETGIFKYYFTVINHDDPSDTHSTEKGNFFVIKAVDSQGEYIANVYFAILEDHAYIHHTQKADFAASCSYADHAERIRKLLNKDELISPYDVKYFFINKTGNFFYIETDGEVFLIPVGVQKTGSGENGEENEYFGRVVSIEGELKEKADKQWEDYLRFIAFRDEWEKEHPGEIFDYTGGASVSPIYSECSGVDNISNIYEYLNIKQPNDIFSGKNLLLIGGIVLIVGLITMGLISVSKARKKS